ncbi:MAG TPA: class I SAM-dependent methyltransferase [Pyrinomonadaceae bacterium]|nr:class I SAM-dependent methyltransferase [Pyrinomonadaceae bacterium]
MTPRTTPPPTHIYDAFAPHYDCALRPLERLLLRRLRAATLQALTAAGSSNSKDNDGVVVGSDNGGVLGGSDSGVVMGDGNSGSSGSRILEIGAGTGLNFAHYPRNAHGAATEPSREMLRRARQKARPARVHLVQNSAEALPFADDTFDAAFATLVFCSLASPPGAFAELRRVVRAGGRVVLLEHVRPANPLGYVFDALSFFTVRLFRDHFNRRTAEDARRAGLRLLRVEPHALGIIQLIVCEV